MFNSVFDVAFLVFSVVRICSGRRTTNKRRKEAHPSSEGAEVLESGIRSAEARLRLRMDEIAAVGDETMHLKEVLLEKEQEARRLCAEVRRAKTERFKCMPRAEEAEGLQAVLSSQLLRKHTEMEALAQKLDKKQIELVSLQRENAVLRSAVSCSDSLSGPRGSS